MKFNPEEYETVDTRLHRYKAEYPDSRIITKMEHYDDVFVVIRADLFDDKADDRPTSTGYAEEKRGQGPVNQTCHVENCETSAIGRALANRGYAPKGKRPSREEMQKVERGKGTTSVAEFYKASALTATSPIVKQLKSQFGEGAKDKVSEYLASTTEPTVVGLAEFIEPASAEDAKEILGAKK